MFRKTLQRLIEAETNKDAAKQRWLDLSQAGDDGQFEARQNFLTVDGVHYAVAQEFIAELSALQELGMTQALIDGLDAETARSLYRLVAELRVDNLIAPTRPTNLAEMVPAWRNAAAMLDAAQRINELRQQNELPEFESLLEDAQSARNPEAWKKAVSIFRFFLDDPRFQQADHSDRAAEAAHAAIRHTRSHHDRLTEQLQTLVESLMDRNALSFELEDLEPEDRRCIQNAISGGLVRQVQTQTQSKPQASSVTTIEAEAESDQQ